MAIAQHYGCPTDLVDITTDYRTAAFFASTNNETHKKTPVGCIWVFPKMEIERLQHLNLNPPEKLIKMMPKAILTKLIENGGSLLLQLDVPQLSRFNAQCGAFLWDMGGLLKKQLNHACIGIRFEFRHTIDERSIFTGDSGRLFPFPNQLESEIMRILTESKRVDGLPEYHGVIYSAVSDKEGVTKKGLPPQMVDNTKNPLYFPLPDFFTPSFGEYQWMHRVVSQKSFLTKSVNKDIYIECHLPFSEAGALSLVQHILKSIGDNSLTDLLILFYKDEKLYAVPDGDEDVLIDIVITLSNFLYTDVEIAKVVLEWLKMLIFKMDNGYIAKSDLDFEHALFYGYVNDWVAKYYGCRVTKLHLGEANLSSKWRFWLPDNYFFLDSVYQEEFAIFDKSCYEVPKILRKYLESLSDNAEIFLYQHTPQRIMPYETMKKMFIDLFLPQQFAFRRKTDRVYIPDYIDKICLPFFGRELFGFSEIDTESEDDNDSLILV